MWWVAGALALAYLARVTPPRGVCRNDWGLRALSSLLSAMQGQKALGPEPLQATTHTEAASRRLRVGGAVG